MSTKRPEQDHPVPAALLSALGAHAFERRSDGSLTALGDVPAELARIARTGAEDTEGHGFLGSFLAGPPAAWMDEEAAPSRSGQWREDVRGTPWTLEATAFRWEGRRLLVLTDVAKEHSERHAILQGARETLLHQERLAREIQLRDLLLHAIVHDLGGPLTALQASLRLLQDQELTPDERAELLDIVQRSADRLCSMQNEVLTGFRAELRTLDPAPAARSGPPNIRDRARSVVRALSPAARERGVSLVCDEGESPADWSTAGESSRLERVLTNLVENALRHAPEGSHVTLALAKRDGEVEASVEDRGPGVPAALTRRLFRRGTQGGNAPGRAGLGLYFSRLTVERWGGSVGYSPREGGGARFWVRLPAVGPRPMGPRS